ncbi:BrnT family toxin [Deltaproteobacteria bacterium PRO3]|nr:BrnT family toxin [Deltaproteobacteria bacterium PRO3]
MKFEFDAAKSRSNLQKHGVDFVVAQEIWQGPYVNFLARAEFENRFAIIGPLDGKLFTCIYTIRGDRIRIISCRRSREKEAKLYEKSL